MRVGEDILHPVVLHRAFRRETYGHTTHSEGSYGRTYTAIGVRVQERILTLKKKSEGQRKSHRKEAPQPGFPHGEAVSGHAVLCVNEGDQSGHIAHGGGIYQMRTSNI